MGKYCQGQAGCLGLLSQRSAKLEWQNFGETLEDPEDPCEFSLNDSCPYHILLGTYSTSAALELVGLGGLRAGTRIGYTREYLPLLCYLPDVWGL